jgi:hypothetical protein
MMDETKVVKNIFERNTEAKKKDPNLYGCEM